MNRYRAFIGDLHGSIKSLNSALSKIDIENTDVYFLGDYVDRGRHSKEVLEKLIALTNNYSNVFCILGNHDKMFLDFVYTGDNLGFVNDPALNTLNSFFDSELRYNGLYDVLDKDYHYVTKSVREKLVKDPIVHWLISLPLYLETDTQIITHAGIDKTLENWKNTSNMDFMWIRPNLMIPNNTGKDIIMGHTMTYKFLGSSQTQPDIYVSSNTHEYFVDTANYQYDNAKVLLYDTETNVYSTID